MTPQFIFQPFQLELQVSEDEAEYEDRVVMTDEEGRTRHVSILDPLLPMFHTSNFHTSSTVPGFFLTKLLYFFHLQQSVGDVQRRQRLQEEDITIGKNNYITLHYNYIIIYISDIYR